MQCDQVTRGQTGKARIENHPIVPHILLHVHTAHGHASALTGVGSGVRIQTARLMEGSVALASHMANSWADSSKLRDNTTRRARSSERLRWGIHRRSWGIHRLRWGIRRRRYGLSKMVCPVTNCRGIGKADMKHNSATPKITVDPETYQVTADGVHLTCAPADKLPLAQRYFLF
eukprot:7226161-Pyramimonas_sp.AAC.1